MTVYESAPGERTKSVLFCPECGHESPIDGDWISVDVGASRHIDCPECQTTVTVRPTGRPSAVLSSGTQCGCHGD